MAATEPLPSPPEATECRLHTTSEDVPCPRCGNQMIWTKASWHCLTCHYKEGCC